MTETRAGTDFGHYRLLRLLGRGGMGEVYLAEDTVKGREVALKLLPAEVAQDSAFRERFTHESQTAARLSDPHVIPIHDYGEIDGTLYLDMRLVDGSNLAQIVAAGPLPAARAVDLIGQVASALDSAHRNGLVHRDVKPANVQVTPQNFAYLLDFGLVVTGGEERMTSAGMFVGSQAYAAPERFDGGGADAAGDVYSLACMLYELLVGHPPFVARNISEMMRMHMFTPPPRPSVDAPLPVPAALDAVVAKGMAKQPAERYPTCGSLALAATAALTSTPQSWGATATVPSANRPAAAPYPSHPSAPGTYYPAQSMPPQSLPPQSVPGAQFPASTPPSYVPGQPSGMLPAPRRNRALWPALAVVAVVLLVAVGVVTALVLSGNDSAPRAKPVATTAAAGATTESIDVSPGATTTAPVVRAAQPPNSAICPGGTDAVFGTVAADKGAGGPNDPYTSCEFAGAVAAAYRQLFTAPASGAVSAVSPKVPELGPIAMNCVGATNIVTCKGGNNAIVYIY